MSDLFSRESTGLIVADRNRDDLAGILFQNTDRPFSIQKITFDLTTARTRENAFVVGFPFRSVFVSAATDILSTLNMVPITNETYQSELPLTYNASFVVDKPLNQAFLYWSAQAGKSITLLFFLNAEYRSGSQISVSGGGVSIVDGSSFTTERVDLVASTATAAVASDSTRKKATIQNNTGADVWFGNSLVSNTGANLGTRLPPGGVLVWQNTGALYAFSVLGYTGDNALQIMKEF